jgi:nucleoside-diphosphate-sugar epimerase
MSIQRLREAAPPVADALFEGWVRDDGRGEPERPPKLTEIFRGCDCIVHIAAWHGIREDRGEKNARDFFDLNVPSPWLASLP